MEENKTNETANESVEVDTTTIEDLKAELEKLKATNEKLKNAQSNASSDAAKYKRQLQERMTEQERAESETKELIAQLKADNERMKREQAVAVRTAAYVGVGFDEILAKKAAESYGDNHEDFIATLKEFLTAHDKALQADALRSTPRPGTGGSAPTVTQEQFDKMTYKDRAKLFEEQPTLYEQLTKE